MYCVMRMLNAMTLMAVMSVLCRTGYSGDGFILLRFVYEVLSMNIMS